MGENNCWEREVVITELTKGRALMLQLQNHFDPMKQDVCQYLAVEILSSYDKALSLLNGTALSGMISKGKKIINPEPSSSTAKLQSPQLLADSRTKSCDRPSNSSKRMLSNRESARRSRIRKQAHFTELKTQVSQLRVENSSLLKRPTDISQKYNEAAVDNRVLKADVETMRAKGKMAEETVKRVTGVNPLFQAMSEMSSMAMPSFSGSPSETSADTAVPVQDDPKHHYYQQPPNNHMPTHDPRIQNGIADVPPIEHGQQNPATSEDG